MNTGIEDLTYVDEILTPTSETCRTPEARMLRLLV